MASFDRQHRDVLLAEPLKVEQRREPRVAGGGRQGDFLWFLSLFAQRKEHAPARRGRKASYEERKTSKRY
jgi:hypothetical protein